jgi:thioredoxin reductase (NADPH)
LVLTDGTEVSARAVIVASGARYRKLPLDRWAEFEGAGIYYAATELEARACSTGDVAVVGGANSAGQAALFLAARLGHAHLIVRGSELESGMSRYLVERIHADSRVELHTSTDVKALHGTTALEAISIGDSQTGRLRVLPCQGLFCFIGAVPASDWLESIARDGDGFVLTDHDVPGDCLSAFLLLGRMPLPFETSLPGVFAAGDVRHGSSKRVAAAVGEGASAVRSVHQAIGA